MSIIDVRYSEASKRAREVQSLFGFLVIVAYVERELMIDRPNALVVAHLVTWCCCSFDLSVYFYKSVNLIKVGKKARRAAWESECKLMER